MAEYSPNHLFHQYLMSAVQYEKPWRKRNDTAFKYYDGVQWTQDEENEISRRGQQPTVINTIKPTVDMVSSIEKDRRVDIQVTGREEGDDKKATLLTALLKHVFDQCNFSYYHAAGFKEAYIGGRSFFECMKYTDETGKDLIKVEKLPWENVYLDPFSRKPDASDARFIIKVKWIDKDLVKELYKDASVMIDDLFNSTYDHEYHGQEEEAQESVGGFYYDKWRSRIRVCECYYTRPEKKTIYKTDSSTGVKTVRDIWINAIHYVVFSDDIILQGSATDHSMNKNPLGINYYPLIPLYCSRDREGRPYGGVYALIDIQDQINKLNSKFLWTLSSNRLLAEVGALQDVDGGKAEFQRPDGLVLLNEGGLGRVQIDNKSIDLSYMANHVNFLMSTEQRISGVNDSMLGFGGTNERSGIMQSVRIAQGSAMQTDILENMYFCKRRIAEVVLRLIGKFYTDYRVVRIVGQNGITETYEYNKPVTAEQLQEMQMSGVESASSGDSAVMPQMRFDRDHPSSVGSGAEGVTILNKIDDTLYYDVVLKEVQPFNTMRERMLSIFSEVLKTQVIPPPIAAKILLSLADIPNKEDLLLELENFYKEQQIAAQASAIGEAQRMGEGQVSETGEGSVM